MRSNCFQVLSIILFLSVFNISAAQSLQDRVASNSPDRYRQISSVHAGAGDMQFMGVVGADDLTTNFLYLHAGIINPNSGIGHHFHHQIEEMYVLLSGEAEFTINGRTSVLQAPVAVPCKMGDSHAVHNHTDEPVKWLNFAVSKEKPNRDRAFDLADDRVGASIDPTPIFVAGSLEKYLLRTENHPFEGNGIKYRRTLPPGVFTTNWHHVDHILIPAGTQTEVRQLVAMEEVYYVMSGQGSITVNAATASIKTDDAIPGLVGEKISLVNTGNEDLEILIIGIAVDKDKGLQIAKPLVEPKAMVLQMDFIVEEGNKEAFEKMYYSIYVPAMTVQDGYIESKLLRLYSEEESKEIEAEPTTYNYQILISFDTEENRRKWVASDQHQIAWPAATSLAKEFKWRGYDVMGDDVMQH